MSYQTIGTIHYRTEAKGRIQYYLHWTFGADLVKMLGWKPRDFIRKPHYDKMDGREKVPNTIIFEPAPDPFFLVHTFQGPDPSRRYRLGTYKDRQSLWLNYPITNHERTFFLNTFSNKNAIKICWQTGVSSLAILSGSLYLIGPGKPFRRGITKRQHRRPSQTKLTK